MRHVQLYTLEPVTASVLVLQQVSMINIAQSLRARRACLHTRGVSCLFEQI